MADGYISEIKLPDNKVYLLKDSEKTDEKVAQVGNAEDKDFPIILKNTNNTTDETANVKYSNNTTTDATTTKPFTFNPSTGTLKVTQIKIGTKDDSKGLFPVLNNWNQIGASNLYWYRSYINNYYGSRSHVDNWDSGKNIGTAATTSAAATKGTVNFYNSAAANTTQTKTLLEANANTNSNITITLPSSTGTLALTSQIPTNLNQLTNGPGYVTSSGITSVTIGATSPVQSSTSTAQTGSSASTTISLKDAYGDTKNPYGTKAKNLVLAGPSSGNNAAPTFRALVAADIPALSYVPATSGANDVNTLVNTGVYNITSGSATNTPKGYGYGQLLVMSYRKHTGNTTTDWASQLYLHNGGGTASGGATAPGNVLYYRTSNSSSNNSWFDWQKAVHAAAAYSKVGDTNKPVYIAEDGTATAISYTIAKSVPADAVFTDTNKYHKTGSWGGTNNLTYTATAVNSADALAFTLATASTSIYGATKLSSATDSTSEALAATPKAVKMAYDQATTALNTANNLLATADALVFKGTLGTGGMATAVPTGGYQAGWTYKIITAGTWAGQVCEEGDLLIAISDAASDQTAVNNAHWTVVQENINGYIHFYNNHDNNIDSLIPTPYLQTAALNGGGWGGTKPSGSHNGVAVFNFQTHSGNYYTQLALDTQQNRMWLRSANAATTFGNWEKIATTADIDALDGNLNSTTPGAGKTLTAFSQTNGKVSATFGNISITESQISDLKSYLPLSGGTMTGHIFMGGSNASSSTANTTQLVFGTSTTQHIAVTSNDKAFILNPSTSSTTNQIVLYLNKKSKFPSGIEGDVTGDLTGNADTATSAGKWTTARTLTIGNKGQSVDGSGNVSWSLADIGAAPAVDGGYLPLSGGKMTGNINMGDMGTPSSYPVTGNKITWTGGTDGAQIYYHVASADAGRLVFNTTDDANCLMALAYNGTFKAYISNNTPSFYPATTTTGSLGLSDHVWSIIYAHTISNSIINTTQASMRHIDAGKNAVQTDHNLYIGYGAQSFTNKTLFYYSTGTTDTTSTRTQFAEINQNGLYALTRFGVNGQNTDYTFYTNGTALITGNSDITGIKYYTHAANAGKTYIEWVKFASIALGNNNYWGDRIYDIFIDRTYNSPSSEVYNIRVSAGWTNSNIIQLSGHAGSRIIKKFRVVRDHTNHKAYFEYYVDPAYNIYQNLVNIKILCYHGAAVTLMNEVQTENDSDFAYKEEIDLANGMVTNGTFNGNATTATGISKTGGSTAKFWRGDNNWSDTLVGPLYINNTTDAGGTGDTGALVIGNKAGENIAIDTNEVMARNNKATSTLYLNNDGGLVSVGSGGLTTSGKLESTGQLRVVNNSSANSDDALVYISNTSSSDWTMKLINSSSNYGLYIEGTGNNLLRVGTNDVLNITDNATSSSDRAVTIKGKLDLKQPSNATLGIDTNLKIGTARKDLNFDLGNGSGTGINGGNGGGITWGNEAAAYAGIYYQCSGAYGSRLLFGTTNSYANGVYARMIIVSDGKIGIGTLNPDELLTVNGNAKATKFIGALEGNVTGNVSGSAGSVAWANVSDRPTNLNQFTNGPGYVTSSGVTSIKLIQGAGITVSSSGTAITTTGERTISITGMDTTNGSTTQWLNKKGGWSTPTAAQVGALASSTVVTNVAISADTTTNKEYALVFGTTPSDGTTPTAAKTEGLQKNITKLYTNPSTGILYSTKFCVDEHVILQYNSTDSSLEFVFA